MKLSQAQYKLALALYTHYNLDGFVRPYVLCGKARKETMYSLFKFGLVTSTFLQGGKPTNMLVTQKLIDYFKEREKIK